MPMKKNVKLTIKRIIFVILFIVLLPLIFVELIIKLISRILRRQKWKKRELDGKKLILSCSITDIDIMPGYEFEEYLKTLLFYMGYKVVKTSKSHDYGADLIISDTTGTKIVVQAKRYSKPVGAKAVQEICTSKNHYGASEGWVITNSTFTSAAEDLAKENQIRLVDRNELIEMYSEVCKQFEIQSQDGKLLFEKTDLNTKFPFYI